ncbi:hypothetical protein [Clostridium lacusfryxellense]|uniref:hypothetical protein n=1 Tax=Clostridium lacusfryxellense TaxID=205328 RepID=UPI001C0BD27B|nr:hypothetical protein [Clostridium lacusfryxellense]MBU3114343.1 hypothetical protein [Clostridium lacusfryxellense]
MFNLEDISKVKGYTKLTVNAGMFESFLKNFINSWGLEARETIKPLEIRFVKERSEKYLRFDYEIYGKKEWLHVTRADNWY